MRDDIHKSAPVPPRWRSVVHACERDADWEVRGPSSAERAVVAELTEGITTPFRNALLAEQGRAQGLLFTEPGVIAGLRAQATSALETRIIDHLERLSSAGRFTREIVRQAISLAASERVSAFLRELEGHLVLRFPKARREMMRRLHQVVRDVRIDQHSTKLASGQRPSIERDKPRSIDLDGDDIRRLK